MGWAKNISSSCKKEFFFFFYKLDGLDKKIEFSQLSDDELNLKHTLNERRAQLLRVEEIIWYQRTTIKKLLEGGDAKYTNFSN